MAESSRSRQQPLPKIASPRKPTHDMQRDERDLERLVNKQSPSITSHDSTEAETPDDDEPLVPQTPRIRSDSSYHSVAYDRKGKMREVATPKPKPKSILVVRSSAGASSRFQASDYKTPSPDWKTLSRLLESEKKPKSALRVVEYALRVVEETPAGNTGSKGLLRFESARSRLAGRLSQYSESPLLNGANRAHAQVSPDGTFLPTHTPLPSTSKKNVTFRERLSIDSNNPSVPVPSEQPLINETSSADEESSSHRTSLPPRTPHKSRIREIVKSQQRSAIDSRNPSVSIPSDHTVVDETSRVDKESSSHQTSLPSRTPHKSRIREIVRSQQRSAIDSRNPAVSIPSESPLVNETSRVYKDASPDRASLPPRTPHRSAIKNVTIRERSAIDSRTPTAPTLSRRTVETVHSDPAPTPHRSNTSERRRRSTSRHSSEQPRRSRSRDSSEQSHRSDSRDSSEQPRRNRSRDSTEQLHRSDSRNSSEQSRRSRSRDSTERDSTERLHRSDSRDSTEQSRLSKVRDSTEQLRRSDSRDSTEQSRPSKIRDSNLSTSPIESSSRKERSLSAEPATPNLSVLTKNQYTPLQNMQMPSSKLQDIDAYSTNSSTSEKFEPDSLYIPEISSPGITVSPTSMKASPPLRPAKGSSPGIDRPLTSTPMVKAAVAGWRSNEVYPRTGLTNRGYRQVTSGTETEELSKPEISRYSKAPESTKETTLKESNSRYKVKEVHIWRWLWLLTLCWLLQTCASSDCIMEATRLEFTASRNLYNGFHRAQFDNPRHPVQQCHDAPQSELAKSLRMVELNARSHWLRAKYTFVTVPRDPWGGHLKRGQLI